MIRARVPATWILFGCACALSSLAVEKSARCASFSAKASAAINFPSPVDGTFSYSVPATAHEQGTTNVVGNAHASAPDPTFAFLDSVLTLAAGPVTGDAGPPSGFAGAVAEVDVGGRVDFPLLTLTNSSNQPFTASFSGSFTYELTTDGGPPPPEHSLATALLLISGGSPIQIFTPPAAGYRPTVEDGADETNTIAVAFDVVIQPNSTVNLDIDLQAAGVAQYVPEPSGLLLVGLGFFALVARVRTDGSRYIDATDST